MGGVEPDLKPDRGSWSMSYFPMNDGDSLMVSQFAFWKIKSQFAGECVSVVKPNKESWPISCFFWTVDIFLMISQLSFERPKVSFLVLTWVCSPTGAWVYITLDPQDTVDCIAPSWDEKRLQDEIGHVLCSFIERFTMYLNIFKIWWIAWHHLGMKISYKMKLDIFFLVYKEVFDIFKLME